MKKTICVDFDGVLNEYNGYEEGNLGEPLSGSQDFIKKLRGKYKVVILTEAFINMVKLTLKDKHHYFRKYVRGCTCCESCEDICEQHAIWIIDPEWEEL